MRRILPLVILIIALVGMVWFSQALRIVDTVGLLTSGAIAGASLASLAAARRKGR
jgi:UPF0716 family protein affecting phage T7 exclusion